MVPAIRICQQLRPGVKAVMQTKDGLLSYKFFGAPKLADESLYHLSSRLFRNASYVIKATPCELDLLNNVTDTQLNGYALTYSEFIDMPVVTEEFSFQILNILKTNEVRALEIADALKIFTPFDISSCLATLFCIMCFIILIAGSVFVQNCDRNRLSSQSNGRRNHLVRDETHLKDIAGHMMDIFYYSSELRFVCLLYSLLIFALIVGMGSEFTTSQVAVEIPQPLKSYDEVIKHPTCLPIMPSSNRKFVENLLGSRGVQMLQKVLQSGKNTSEYLRANPVRSQARTLTRGKNVKVVMKSFAPIMKYILCHLSPINELWKVELFTDPSERHRPFGWPLSRLYRYKDYFVSRMRQFIESGLNLKFYEIYRVTYESMYRSRFSNRTHYLLQERACSYDFKLDEVSSEVVSTGPPFFSSLMILVVALIIASCVSSILEKRKAGSSEKKRRKLALRRAAARLRVLR